MFHTRALDFHLRKKVRRMATIHQTRMKARNRRTDVQRNRHVQHLQPISECINVTTQPHVSQSPVLNKHGAENGYWDEIAALCIEEESLRVQTKLLKKAVSNERWIQEHFATIDNAVVVLLSAVEDVNTLSYLVNMLGTA